MNEKVQVQVEADTTSFAAALRDLSDMSDKFGRQLTGGLRSAVTSGRTLEDVLRRVGLNLAGMALDKGLAPLQGLAGSFLKGLFGGLGSIMPFAKGGVVPFASGGVVSSPTYFPLGRGSTGLMGEAGPEAIMPLSRGADGRLGVAMQGGGGPVNIVLNVHTPDAASFRKSEAQIGGMLARAVSRGARPA